MMISKKLTAQLDILKVLVLAFKTLNDLGI